MNWIYQTAWPMIPWKAYGIEHLSFTIVGFLVSILLAWRLRKMSQKRLDHALFIVGILLMLSELYKQLFYYFVIGHGSYQWWIFPFQLCSVPIYLCLAIPFVTNEKVKGGMYAFMVSYNLMGGFVAFLEPSGLIHEYWTLTLHAFFWHMTLVFIGMMIAFNRNSGIDRIPFKECFGVFVGLCIIAFILNLAMKNVSNGAVNMFYVGPSDSPIIVFKDICKKFGWYVNTPLYMGALTGGAYLFFWFFKKANHYSVTH